jgi:hypothetical protein
MMREHRSLAPPQLMDENCSTAKQGSRPQSLSKTAAPLPLVIEVKGYDERSEVKAEAAQKWVDAVNANAAYGK